MPGCLFQFVMGMHRIVCSYSAHACVCMVGVCVCVYMRACVRACVRVCVGLNIILQ